MVNVTALKPTIPFNSSDGQALFHDLSPSELNAGVMSSYTPQQHRNFCGVASIITVLAAGRRDETRFLAQVDDVTFLNQENLFTDEVNRIRSLEQVKGLQEGDYPGLSFENVAAILALYFSEVDMIYGSELNEDSWLNLLHEKVIRNKMKMIANFDAAEFHSGMGGHTAPVAALHLGRKMLLVADPAQHKTGWYWVHAADLLVSMRRLREGNTKSRGLVCVK